MYDFSCFPWISYNHTPQQQKPPLHLALYIFCSFRFTRFPSSMKFFTDTSILRQLFSSLHQRLQIFIGCVDSRLQPRRGANITAGQFDQFHQLGGSTAANEEYWKRLPAFPPSWIRIPVQIMAQLMPHWLLFSEGWWKGLWQDYTLLWPTGTLI